MTALCKPLCQSPHLLNTSVFSPRPIHPFGLGAPWSEADADLSSAVVISLSALGKTGRAFSWELARNQDVSKRGPLALLQFTLASSTLAAYDTALPVRSASYDDSSTMAWVQQFKPSRVVIVDYGASTQHHSH